MIMCFKRLCAFIIDSLIILIICSLLSFPFVDGSKINKLMLEFNDSYQSYIDNKIDDKVFVNQAEDISYDILRINSLVSVISIAISIFYFVIYQYKSGQTIGKKIFKIKIEGVDRELNINDYIFRSFIGYGLLFNLLNVIILMFLPKDMYIFTNMALIYSEFLILFICAAMVIFRKDHRGLHDLIGHTKVINV